jgi:thiol:disulfide interchange protein DsbD
MKLLLRTLAIALFAVPSFAQLTTSSPFGLPPQGSDRVKLTIAFDKASYQPGEEIHGVVHAAIEKGWHINSVKPLEDFAIPSTVEITSPSMKVGKVDWPAHEVKALAFAAGAKLAVYEGTINLPFTATRLAGDDAVHVKLHYQACDDSVCLPPRDVAIDSKLGAIVEASLAAPATATVATTSTASATGTSATTTAATTTATTTTAITPPASTAEPTAVQPAAGSGFVTLQDAPDQKTSLFSGDIAGIFRTRGLLLTLVAIFLVGLALNLTPCVYPLIPITLAFFASQTEGKKSRQISLALAYVLGLAGMYAALGVVAALTGSLFGAWLQSPAVLIFFAMLMLVLAASMFGLFEFRVPHFISDRAGAKSGYAGALMMGLFAGIVAAPCVGPVVVSLIALVGQMRDPVVGTLMFVVLALGLGFPYLIGLSSLPRSGAWMVTIKKALGFILIAMAFYFLRGVAGELVFRWGVTASLIVGALFLLFLGRKAGSGRALTFALAALLLIGGLFFLPRKGSTVELAWEPYSEARLAAAKAEGKPVIIDFFADWCIPCKELDEKTFGNAAVADAAGRFVRLKADLTRSDDEATKALTKKYNVVGVPTIVFIDANGSEVASSRLTGFEKPEPFLQRLSTVK